MNWRTVTAFLVAPSVPAVLWPGITYLTAPGAGISREWLATFVVVYIFAGTGTAVFLLPAYLILARHNMVRWWSAVAAGAALGYLFAILIGRYATSPWLRGRIPLTLVGSTSGFIFWLIVCKSKRLTVVGADSGG
jgi:hypothetical protein